MDKEKQVTVGIRVPPPTRNALASLARMSGMTISEVSRWVLMRAVDQEASTTYAALRALAVARFGPNRAELMERMELERMEYLVSGQAIETPNGQDITFVVPETEGSNEETPTPATAGTRG
jgi:hypothetical protein